MRIWVSLGCLAILSFSSFEAQVHGATQHPSSRRVTRSSKLSKPRKRAIGRQGLAEKLVKNSRLIPENLQDSVGRQITRRLNSWGDVCSLESQAFSIKQHCPAVPGPQAQFFTDRGTKVSFSKSAARQQGPFQRKGDSARLRNEYETYTRPIYRSHIHRNLYWGCNFNSHGLPHARGQNSYRLPDPSESR